MVCNVEIRGQLAGGSYLLLPYGTWDGSRATGLTSATLNCGTTSPALESFCKTILIKSLVLIFIYKQSGRTVVAFSKSHRPQLSTK